MKCQEYDTTVGFKNNDSAVIRGSKPIQGKRALFILPTGIGATVIVPYRFANSAEFKKAVEVEQ